MTRLFYLRVLLLAPGVMLHELAHHIFCVLTGVRVHRVVYFRFGSPAGYVIHEEPEFYRQIFAIVAGPFFLNSAVAVVLLNLALRQAVRADEWTGQGLVLGMAWLGISAALQALPSRADAGISSEARTHICFEPTRQHSWAIPWLWAFSSRRWRVRLDPSGITPF